MEVLVVVRGMGRCGGGGVGERKGGQGYGGGRQQSTSVLQI